MTDRSHGKYSDVRINRVPHAREVLRKLAATMRADGHPQYADEIVEIVYGLMYREYKKPVARARRSKITSLIVRDVLRVYYQNPLRPNHVIGEMFNIDGGRVSEIIKGLRTEEDPTMSRFNKAGKEKKND